MASQNCDFEKQIFDPKIKKLRKITCNEIALDSGKCRFHDKNYLKSNDHGKIANEILEKINDAIKNNQNVECIGYYIPEIHIESKIFENQAFFSYAHFVDNIVFDYSEFRGFSDFSNCVFEKESYFNNTEFHKNVEFSNCVFKDNVYFDATKFHGRTYFSSSEFENASFLTTEFNKSDFTDANFKQNVSFVNTEFKDKTLFINTIFDNAKFNYSKFENMASFSLSEFHNQAQFRNTIFIIPQQVLFDSDLSHVSFLGTDISRVHFGNKTKWNMDKNTTSKIKKMFERNNRFLIYDEWLLENEQEPELNLEDVMDVYRNLRENHDYYLKYETAGEFFVREMELKRKYKKNTSATNRNTVKKKWHEKISLYGIYHVISQYGHSLYRPIFITIPILVIFTILFCYDSSLDPKFENSSSREIFENAIFRSVGSFFPFYSIDKNTNLLDIVLRIILLPLSGTFFIGLKRKLERKFRH